MIRWKASFFLGTSFCLLCLELYGIGKQKVLNLEKDETHDEVLLNETHFLSLNDWAVDREKLYEERLGLVKSVCEEYGVKNVTSNSSMTDYINLNTKEDKSKLEVGESYHIICMSLT